MDQLLQLNPAKSTHSTSQGTHRRKERRRHSKDLRNTIKLHLRQSQRDPKDIFGNGSKWNQNSESSSSTGQWTLGHLLHSQPSTEVSATYNITSTTYHFTIWIGRQYGQVLQHEPFTLKTNAGHVHLKAVVVSKICTSKIRLLYRYRREE